MWEKVFPFVVIILGFFIILGAGIYFALLSGSYKNIQDPNCVVNLTSLNDKAQLELADARCKVAYNLKLMNDRISYNSWSLAHRSASLIVQLFSTVLLLAVVMFIIFFGLVMSYLEFRKGGESSTTLKLGAANLEISSTIIGIVILSISLAFAYIYFDKAYKISEVSTQSAAKQGGPPEK
jgi:hypothetical protein